MSRTDRAARRAAWRRMLPLALALLGAAAGVAAEDTRSAWEFDAELYGWISGAYGTVGVRGHTVHVDVTPSDLLDAVFDGNALAGAGVFSARWDRWIMFTDVMGGGAKIDVVQTIPTPYCDIAVDAQSRAKVVLADFAVGYQVGRWSLPKRLRPFTLDVYAGARYVHVGNDVSGGVAVIGGQRFSGDVSDTTNWADPLIGLRWSLPVLDTVSLGFRADIGGFGASSDLDWGLATDVRYWLSWTPWSTRPYLAAGYRLVALDRSPNDAEVDLQLRGPVAGLGFVF